MGHRAHESMGGRCVRQIAGPSIIGMVRAVPMRAMIRRSASEPVQGTKPRLPGRVEEPFEDPGGSFIFMVKISLGFGYGNDWQHAYPSREIVDARWSEADAAQQLGTWIEAWKGADRRPGGGAGGGAGAGAAGWAVARCRAAR